MILVACPEPSLADPAVPCPVSRIAVSLVAHLVNDHMVGATEAMARVRKAAEAAPASPTLHDPAPRTRSEIVQPQSPEPPPVPPPTPEAAMPRNTKTPLDKPVPCACGASFVRTHGRQKKCPECRGEVTPNRGGAQLHGRSRRDGERLPRKPTGGGKRPSKAAAVPEPRGGLVAEISGRNGDNAARAAAKTLLGHLVELRDSLDGKITVVRELVEIL